MNLKNKDGKYFSQLGNWSDLIRVIILVGVLKIFSNSLLGNVIAFVVLVFFLWGIPLLIKKARK